MICVKQDLEEIARRYPMDSNEIELAARALYDALGLILYNNKSMTLDESERIIMSFLNNYFINIFVGLSEENKLPFSFEQQLQHRENFLGAFKYQNTKLLRKMKDATSSSIDAILDKRYEMGD